MKGGGSPKRKRKGDAQGRRRRVIPKMNNEKNTQKKNEGALDL